MVRRPVVLLILGILTMLSFAIGPQRAEAAVQPPPKPFRVTSLDAHDGTMVQDGSTLYLYGTRYGCGFTWLQKSPFCGFGVWKSTTGVTGPWTFQRLLFSPRSFDSWAKMTWQQVCGDSGRGCFNPRMVKRTRDGVWILAFNAPFDWQRTHANAYYFMGCAGPAGPCGPGATHGSLNKPNLWACTGNGDFSLYTNSGKAYMVCTHPQPTMSLSTEALDFNWTNGIKGQGANNIAGLSHVEGPGMVKVLDKYVLTYATPNCGFCATAMGWAISSTPLGPFVKKGLVTPASTCGGQPRTAFGLGLVFYEWVDIWLNGARNETKANVAVATLSTDFSTLKLTCP